MTPKQTLKRIASVVKAWQKVAELVEKGKDTCKAVTAADNLGFKLAEALGLESD